MTAASSSKVSSWHHFLGNNSVSVDAAAAESSARGKYPKLLHPAERVEWAFTNRGGMGRDKSYLTNRRILLKDGKGIGGKRKNYVSVPYQSIQAFSVETAGKWDGDVDLKVYSTGVDMIKIDFAANQVDLFAILQYMNMKCNWTQPQGTEDYVAGEPPPHSNAQKGSVGTLLDWLGDNASQLSPGVVQQKFTRDFPVLMESEQVDMAFKSGRDYTIFTKKRLLLVDVQGVFGKKVEFTSFPWRSFSGFSVETAGAYFDRDTDIKLHTNIVGCRKVEQDFRQGGNHADLFAIQKYLSNRLLGHDHSSSEPVEDNRRAGHVDPKTSWWFRDNQRPLDAVEMQKYYRDVVPLLQADERVEMAFKGRRDITLFTTKRIIDIDPKGFQGVKIEYTSIPWKSVLAFGIKTAGKHLDTDCEAMIWTDMMFIPGTGEDNPDEPGMSFWEFDFNKDLVNVIAIKKYLSARCLKAAPDIPVPQNVFLVSDLETGLEKFLSKIGEDQRAIDPREIDSILHTSHPILMEKEKTIMAFKAGRDMTLFTSLRILIMDVQGWSGKKVEYTSIPYESIRGFSAESAGSWDRDSEVNLYTRNLWDLCKVKLDFRKGKADIVSIQKFLSAIVMNSDRDAGRFLESQEPLVPRKEAPTVNSFLSFLTNNSRVADALAVNAQLHSDPSILLESEDVTRAFRQGRDLFVYTDRRVLVVDVQGLRGSKVKYKSIPWEWCHGFEFETAGNFDSDAELYLHFDVPHVNRLKQSILVKDFDIYDMHAFVYNTLLFQGGGSKSAVNASGSTGFAKPPAAGTPVDEESEC